MGFINQIIWWLSTLLLYLDLQNVAYFINFLIQFPTIDFV